jgi:hypothetical protein
MKTKIEQLALGSILAPITPLALFMGFWWLSYSFLPEKWIPYGTLFGLLLGILADIFILRRLMQQAYRLGNYFWLVVLLFYSVGIFGFFMGVPVFNAALAIPVGFVVGDRLVHEAADGVRVRRASREACLVTTAVMALVCSASAFFALASPSTPGDLAGMLHLGFEVTTEMIWGLILIGGAGLLAVNWLLTSLSIRLTHRFLSTS